jgi:anti-sigma factor RsiW
MTCQEIPGVIDAYLDGELSVAATLQAHEHFAACENCRRILESEAALHGLLVQAARAEPVPTAGAIAPGPPAGRAFRNRVGLRRPGRAGVARHGAGRAASDVAAGGRAGEQAPAVR